MLVNFGWIRDGRVAGMGQPGPDAWDALAAHGVGAVLVLTERSAAESGAAHGIEVAHVPLVDFGTPSQEDLQRCVAWIDAQIDAGRGVAVHCMAGQGRTGTVLAAWLVGQGAEPAQAINEVRRLRPGSIETRGQVEAVLQFRVGA